MGRPKHSLRSAVSAVAVAQALSSSPAHARFSLGPKLVRHRANGLKNMHFDEHLADEIKTSPSGPWGLHFARNAGWVFERLRVNGNLTIALVGVLFGWKVTRDSGALQFDRPLGATVAFVCSLWLALIEQLRYAPALACLMACLCYVHEKKRKQQPRRSMAGQVTVHYHCVDAKDLPGWKAEDLTGFRETLQWVDECLSTLMITLSKTLSVVAAVDETLTDGLLVVLGVGSVALAALTWLLSWLPTWLISSVGLIVGFGPWVLGMSADAASSLVHEWWVVSLVLPLGLWPPIWHRFAIAASVSAVPLVLLPLLARLQGGGTQQGHAADQAQMSGDDTRDSVSVSTAAVNAPPCDGVLHVLVVGCSNVLPADKNGKSDVYVRVMLGQQQQQHKKTTVKSKTLNPVFNEQLDIEINSNRLQEQGQLSSLGTAAAAPWSLSVEAWDRDVSRDDFLGEATVDLPSMFASAGGRGGGWCENVFLVHLSHINDYSTKAGSGQTKGKHSKKIQFLRGRGAPIDCEYELADPNRRLSSSVKQDLDARIAAAAAASRRGINQGPSVCPYGSVRLKMSFAPSGPLHAAAAAAVAVQQQARGSDAGATQKPARADGAIDFVSFSYERQTIVLPRQARDEHT